MSFVTDKQPDMYRQTQSALAHIDATLQEAGTDKSRILTAIVYIADMARKPEMNRAWDEWADRNSPPMRACLAVTLEGATLVEIVVTAVVVTRIVASDAVQDGVALHTRAVKSAQDGTLKRCA